METSPTPPTSLDDLKPGMSIRGQVTRLELSGAVVDVGLGVEGLIHISRLRRGRVNRVDEVVQPGQDVEAWVEQVDSATGRLELTLIRPIRLRWHDLRPGLRTTGQVVGIERYGAFVDIGAERSGLVHISEMGQDYVGRPEDVVKVGESVEVVVLEADAKKRQIRLSLKAAQPAEVVVAEEEPPPATEMEIALRRALEGAATLPATRDPRPGKDRRKGRKDQDELLARTLQQKEKTTSGN